MAAHVASDEDWGSFERTRDLVHLFQERGLVDPPMGERWLRMIGFRNLLVHDYLEIDRRRVYGVLQENLGDLEALVSGRITSAMSWAVRSLIRVRSRRLEALSRVFARLL